jgi:hypothetical protein
MTSVHVAAKTMAAADEWDSDGSLSWEDFFGKKMNTIESCLQHLHSVMFVSCGIYGQLRPF